MLLLCTLLKELHGTSSKKPLISSLPLVTLLVNEKVESNTNMIFVCPKLSNFYFCFVAPKYDKKTTFRLSIIFKVQKSIHHSPLFLCIFLTYLGGTWPRRVLCMLFPINCQRRRPWLYHLLIAKEFCLYTISL